MHTLPTAFTRRPQIGYFLLVSLGLHIGMVLQWTPAFQFSSGHDTVMTVNFDTTHQETSPHTPTMRSSGLEKRKPSVTTAMPNSAAEAKPQKNAEAANSSALTEVERDLQIEATRTRVLAQLLADLERHFEYPLPARSRGWQGTVLVSFTLESDGALQRIHVARSSGYDVLDHSAIAALKRVGRLSEVKQWLNGQTFDMHVPVIYKLKDN